MKYLYGDATPFPLQENFIETISAATDMCVALFKLDEDLVERRRTAGQIKKQADEEVHRLAALATAVEGALRPFTADGEVATARATANKLSEMALAAVKQTRSSVIARRDSSLRATIGSDRGSRILEAIEGFSLRHQLPKTQWQLRWVSGHETGTPELALAAMTPSNLHMGFRADIPDLNRWTGPVRIEDIDPTLRIELQHKESGWLRRQSSAKRSIHKFFITQVEISPEHAWFELKQHPGRSSVGYEVSVRGIDQGETLIYPVEDDGERGEALSLSGDGEVSLLELWDTIEQELRELIDHRNRLVWARLDDTDAEDLERPGELAENLLMALAPIIREIRVRSRVPGELVLKRDLSNGRREELFVPRKEIERKYASLSYEYRACFNAVGLGAEATQEFVQRQLPLKSKSDPRATPSRLDEDDDEDDPAFDAKPTVAAGPLAQGKDAAAQSDHRPWPFRTIDSASSCIVTNHLG